MSSPTYKSSLFLIVALLLTPFVIWVELNYKNIWDQRLIIPHINDVPDFHTPRFANGYFLPSQITHNTVIGPEKNPVILSGTVHIPRNVTLTFQPGTQIYANEFASLVVSGDLLSQGTKKSAVIFTTNEQHWDNQNWAGIIVEANGKAQISNNTIRYASPGVSCIGSSVVTIDNTYITDGSTGVFATSPSCAINRSRIAATRVGVEAVGVTPSITETAISARRKQTDIINR